MFWLLRSLGAYFRIIRDLFKVFIHLLYGIWKLSHLKKQPVTIFGGARLKQDSLFMKQAAQLAQQLAEIGIPVLTGGGPGIMEAATCGISQGRENIVATIGITVRGLEEGEERSKCYRHIIEMDNFSSRKWLLIRYSGGFAVFPGGFGTLDELTELLTLIQTNKRERAPIVLIGVDYWKPLMTWIHESALAHGLISQKDITLFTITDDVDEALKLLKAHCLDRPFTLF